MRGGLFFSENMCQDHGVKYESPTVISEKSAVQNSDDCAATCHASTPCKFWEFSAKTKSCRLIGSYVSASFIGGSNIISGVSPCPKGSDPCEWKNFERLLLSLTFVSKIAIFL